MKPIEPDNTNPTTQRSTRVSGALIKIKPQPSPADIEISSRPPRTPLAPQKASSDSAKKVDKTNAEAQQQAGLGDGGVKIPTKKAVNDRVPEKYKEFIEKTKQKQKENNLYARMTKAFKDLFKYVTSGFKTSKQRSAEEYAMACNTDFLNEVRDEPRAVPEHAKTKRLVEPETSQEYATAPPKVVFETKTPRRGPQVTITNDKNTPRTDAQKHAETFRALARAQKLKGEEGNTPRR